MPGLVNETIGKIKETTGHLFGNENLEKKGLTQKELGQAERRQGSNQDLHSGDSPVRTSYDENSNIDHNYANDLYGHLDDQITKEGQHHILTRHGSDHILSPRGKHFVKLGASNLDTPFNLDMHQERELRENNEPLAHEIDETYEGGVQHRLGGLHASKDDILSREAKDAEYQKAERDIIGLPGASSMKEDIY